MVPPVLVDINKDGTVDIIIAMFNATVFAFDGETFKIIWQYSFTGSETYSYVFILKKYFYFLIIHLI